METGQLPSVLAEINRPEFRNAPLNENATKPNNAQWRYGGTGNCNPPVDANGALAFRFKAALLFLRFAMDSRLLGKRSFYQFSYAIDRNSVVDA
ncbi:hypothetical protein IVB15_18770 [Bradyrhizobium sp. 182]|uniref:hypothetical protein n=1 Tax=unclassified Bradyrhizobium TaxID=2631580 RepID=UPI001FFB0B9F|nr:MULTISPECIES: hypothetical protein [unclassified Bradyrhizobium]MCK1419809.1 hypothetical protein [Bradyrhizobium sp. CW12]MCK1529712.1 hypothetical protein [Bradyrhizobium sp. 182]MCK1617048.1 hypothetical protein [Bradyrhizobium sp. 159]MCK1646072.1 hypothetical protein [Bradyrhizobium sp. 154]